MGAIFTVHSVGVVTAPVSNSLLIAAEGLDMVWVDIHGKTVGTPLGFVAVANKDGPLGGDRESDLVCHVFRVREH